jgi:hypothetical protein
MSFTWTFWNIQLNNIQLHSLNEYLCKYNICIKKYMLISQLKLAYLIFASMLGYTTCSAKPKWCWLFPSIIRVLCTMSMFNKVSISTCWDLSVLQCDKQPQRLEFSKRQIHSGDEPAHSAQLFSSLTKHSMPQVRQPPCSPDMAPCGFSVP